MSKFDSKLVPIVLLPQDEKVLSESEKKSFYTMMRRLEEFYPEHKTYAMDVLCSASRDAAKKLAKVLGYDSLNAFLGAYGFEPISGAAVYELRKNCGYNQPGNEPACIKERLENAKNSLAEYYPDGMINRAIQSEHSSLGDNISGFYQFLGYESSEKFLNAYGYTCNFAAKGGRPKKNDFNATVEELKKRYPDGTDNTVQGLATENPDLPIDSLRRNPQKECGDLSFGEYLVKLGILKSASTKRTHLSSKDVMAMAQTMLETLKERYPEGSGHKFARLQCDNPDLPWEVVRRDSQKLFGMPFVRVLENEGILLDAKSKLDSIGKALLEKYKDASERPTTTLQLMKENPDLRWGEIGYMVRTTKGKTVPEYFSSLGVLAPEKTDEEKLDEMTRILTERYVGTGKKVSYIMELEAENTDVSFPLLKKLTKTVVGKTLTEYLVEKGILCDAASLLKAKRAEEKRKWQEAEKEKRTNAVPDKNGCLIEDGVLGGKVCCLTGDFSFGQKSAVEEFIVARGGTCSSSVTKKTNMLIIGDMGSALYAHGNYGSKYIKAKQMQDDGADMTIIKESDFFKQYTGEVSAAERTFDNDAVEAFCYSKFEEYALDQMLKKAHVSESIFKKSGVTYADGGEKVSAFVLKCAIAPYVVQLKEQSIKYGVYFTILKDCDEVASHFEKKSFAKFLDTLAHEAYGYLEAQLWIPVCRFGDGKIIQSLIGRFKDWHSWHIHGGRGRTGIMICSEAIMLSDTREAMMYAEKGKKLVRYARMRGTTADVIRDTKLADFGFDENGKKVYDIGSTVIEVSMNNDLTVVLYDTGAGKIVKSVPKKGADVQKYESCTSDLSELKKNVKKVVKARNNLLFEYYLSGKSLDASAWLKSYTSNPVLRKVASLLVWQQGTTTFTLSGGNAIDSNQNPYTITESPFITVAHPLEMDDADIYRWQIYFASKGLKQPFEQIWEPKVNIETITPDRYKGCMIPYYRFLNQEKRGISVYDEDFHNYIEISMSGCETKIERIDWVRHQIDARDQFEIKEFRIQKLDRRTNNIVYYLDKCTVYGRIERDDTSIIELLPTYTVAQVEDFLKYSIEKGCAGCTALLLGYKNEHFPEFAGVDEFTLD